MKLFRKKEKIVLRSVQQKEDFIEKLEKANVAYDIREDRDDSSFIIRVYAGDLQKVM